MLKHHFGAALCALCLVFLCGCGASGAASSRSVLMAAPPQSTGPAAASANGAEAPARPDEAMSLHTAAPSLSAIFTGSEAGAYTLATYDDGSADLLYFDYASAQMLRLDNPPRQNDAQQGLVTDVPGGVTPLYTGGALYLFHLGGSPALQQRFGEGGQASVLRLAPDGTAPQKLVLPAGWSFVMSSAVLADEGHLYFLVHQAQGEAAITLLVQLDTTAMAYEVLHQYESGMDYSLQGSWAMGPLVQISSPLPPADHPEFNAAWAARSHQLVAQGMYTGTTRPVFQWQQGTAVSVQQQLVYYWSNEEGALFSLNADDDTGALVAEGFAPAGYVQASLQREVLDGKLVMQFSTNSYMRDFTVELASGEVTALPTRQLGDNVTICAEAPDAFFISYGEAWASRDKVPYAFVPGMDFTATPGYAKMPQYALVPKGDYWAGRRGFAPFADLVFDAKPKSAGATTAPAAE